MKALQKVAKKAAAAKRTQTAIDRFISKMRPTDPLYLDTALVQVKLST